MKYNTEIAQEIGHLDSIVITQKELDLSYHKLSHLKKQLHFYSENPVRARVLERNIQDVQAEINVLEGSLGKEKETVTNLRKLIQSYMELHQVSIPSVSRFIGVSVEEIELYLQMGLVTPETKKFIIWASRNFRLDLNLYANLFLRG